MKSKQAIEIPQTEGIKYAGSKLKLLPHILDIAAKTDSKTILDGFAGTTRVSQAFAKSGYRVISNDSSIWSKIFGLCYLKNSESVEHYESMIEHLNNLTPIKGWFTENYGGSPDTRESSKVDGLKKPFQTHNTQKLDAIRDEIADLDLGEVEESVLLTSLILALDKVDSTIGHHASYLNQWSARSYKQLKLEIPKIFQTDESHEVSRGDIFDVIDKCEADLAYFDPPYGSNNEKMPPSRVRYSAYYHLWTSIILNDKPEVFGKAKRRTDSSDTKASSVFEEFRRDENGKFIAANALEILLAKTKAKHIILSYSSGGRATARDLFAILEGVGDIIEFVKIDYKRNVMASMRWTNDWTREENSQNEEYLFLINKA
ncbi:MAG: DNA methyltransferase [Pyrinomonadaceae bacterium]|nr:DNA methyltransferase [Pyrinomonadaceae bacterium]